MTQVPQYSKISRYSRKLLLRNTPLLIIAIPGSVSITGLLSLFLESTPPKALVLPLLVAAVCLSLYFITFVLDLISGLKASRYEAVDKSDYFQSAKGWNSIWKISVVFILIIASTGFSMLAALAEVAYLPNFFLIAAGIISGMAILLDIYSIGENQRRITGKKSRIFDWLDQITKVLNEGISEKLRSIFK